MRHAIVIAVVVMTSTVALFAPSSAAATPPPPPDPPIAGCSDWVLSTWWPMSVDDPRWVFQCEEGYIDPTDWSGYWIANLYYWRQESSEVRWYGRSWFDGWFWSCILYPEGFGACNA